MTDFPRKSDSFLSRNDAGVQIPSTSLVIGAPSLSTNLGIENLQISGISAEKSNRLGFDANLGQISGISAEKSDGLVFDANLRRNDGLVTTWKAYDPQSSVFSADLGEAGGRQVAISATPPENTHFPAVYGEVGDSFLAMAANPPTTIW